MTDEPRNDAELPWWAARPEPEPSSPASAEPVAAETPAAEPVAEVPPTEPVEPSEPAAPSEPGEPVVPSEPVVPTEPAEPGGPAEPSEPVVPSEPVAPSEPVVPSEPPAPEPAEPAPFEPPAPFQPPAPVEPAAPPFQPPAPFQPEPPTAVERIELAPAEVAVPGRWTTPLAAAAAVSLIIFVLLAAALTTVTTVKLADKSKQVPCGPVGSGQQLAEVSAAASGVKVVLSYDYRHLDADFAAAERLLTPAFRKKYVDTTDKGVKPLAVKYKAITSAEVTGAGLVSTTRGRCDHVLVLVQQTVTNSQLAQPRLDRARIDVSMLRVNDHWLINDLNPV